MIQALIFHNPEMKKIINLIENVRHTPPIVIPLINAT
jgi:hypothetical protein